MQRNWILLLTFCVFLPWPGRAENPDYNFSLAAINGQTIDGYQLTPSFGGSTPCINDVGEIVFTGTYLLNGNYTSALFTPHHIIVNTGDKIDGQILTSVDGCSLNNFGALVFLGVVQSGKSALYGKLQTFPAKPLAVQGDKIDGQEIQGFFDNFVVNDAGEVVFYASYYECVNHTLQSGLFAPNAFIVGPGSKVDGYVLTGIDNMFALSSRHLYFHAFNATIGDGIFTPHKVIVKEGDVIGGFDLVPQGSNSTFSYLAASDNGRLLFGATYPSGSGLFSPRSIFAVTGNLAGAVNDSGDVVYLGSDGLVVNQTPLINFGDSVDGHILNGLGLPAAINNRGDIVFNAVFTGGYEGIVLATPKH